MGKNLTIKGGENCFWLCQNTLYNVLVLLIKCFSHVMGSMNQCLNVLVKGVVGSCRNVPLFLWRVRIQPCQMKICFLFTQPRISQAFSLLQVSSTQRCLAHQCQTRAFPVSDSSRYSLTHLTAAVFHQSQCDLRKKKKTKPLTAAFPRDVILFCPQFGVLLPWYGAWLSKKSCRSKITRWPDLCVLFLVLSDQLQSPGVAHRETFPPWIILCLVRLTFWKCRMRAPILVKRRRWCSATPRTEFWIRGEWQGAATLVKKIT